VKFCEQKGLFLCTILSCAFLCSCQRAGPSGPEHSKSAQDREILTEFLPSGEPIEMVLVSQGFFWMGADDTEIESRPFRRVNLDRFYIDRYEVTVAQFRACVRDGACFAPASGEDCNWQVVGRSDHPINCVSWFDAQRFCLWAGKRLPTEAEWEKAARGTDARLFPWGIESPDCERAITVWKSLGCGKQGTWPVGSKPAGASPYGAHDMVGNVWEWAADAYEVDFYERAPASNPINRVSAEYRVLRGNSWYYSYPPLVSRVSNRFRFRPARWYPYIGFRCVKSEQGMPMIPDVEPPTASVMQYQNWIERNLAARQTEGERPFDTRSVSDEMVFIPKGHFFMGSDRGESDEVPVRRVYVKAFEIDKYEVTVAQFRKCVDAGVCKVPEGLKGILHSYEANLCNWGVTNRDNHPINCMRWKEADAYCRWTGKRLPTEAEWEKAARGSDARRFPWGNEQANCDRAVVDDGGDGCGRESTWPVGSKPQGASPYGVMDMSGNVWEWVADWYDHGYYKKAPAVDPYNDQEVSWLPGRKPGKVLRGGSWADQTAIIHRGANRLEYDPDTFPDYTVGFRCARDAR